MSWSSPFAGELSSAAPGGGGDVLVCGDDAAAKVRVADLVRNLGLPKGTVPAFRLATIPPGP